MYDLVRMGALPARMSMHCVCAWGASGGQGRVLDLLELALLMAVSHHVGAPLEEQSVLLTAEPPSQNQISSCF